MFSIGRRNCTAQNTSRIHSSIEGYIVGIKYMKHSRISFIVFFSQHTLHFPSLSPFKLDQVVFVQSRY